MGNISTKAEAKNALDGSILQLWSYPVWVIGTNITRFENNGTIKAEVEAGLADDTSDLAIRAAGFSHYPADNSSLQEAKNSGTIEVNIKTDGSARIGYGYYRYDPNNRAVIFAESPPPPEEPPFEEPPVEQPPFEPPPSEQPPSEQPLVEQPPVEQPPSDQPPSGQPLLPPPGNGGGIVIGFTPQPERFIPFVASANAASSGIVSNILMERIFNPAIERILEPERVFRLGDNNRKTLLASTPNTVPKIRKEEESEKGSVFVFPFYSYITARDLGFSAKGGGVGFGFDLRLSENLKAALYGAYARADIDYKTKGALDGDQNIYGAGFYIDYYKKPWFITFINFGYIADNKYKGLTGPNFEISERADFWSRGIDSKLLFGYMVNGDNWVIIPKAGLGFTYSKVDSFRTKTSDPNWSRHVKSDSLSYATGYAGALASKRWDLGDVKVYLTGLLRLEQVLGNNHMATTQSIPALGSGEVKVKKDVANTTLRGRVELDSRIKGTYGIGIMRETAVNANYKSYGARLTFTRFF